MAQKLKLEDCLPRVREYMQLLAAWKRVPWYTRPYAEEEAVLQVIDRAYAHLKDNEKQQVSLLNCNGKTKDDSVKEENDMSS